MKNRIIFSLLFILMVTFNTSAKQDKYVKHTVAQGETITMIAQKYKVTPYDIYKLNPDSQKGIELNSVLLIPPTVAESSFSAEPKQTSPKAPGNPTTHLVQPKETLFSLSRQYGVTVEAIKSANAELLKDGLKTGQTIKVPTSSGIVPTTIVAAPAKAVVKETPKAVVKSEPKTEMAKGNTTYHIIEPKETKYGISKKYGMTIQELERLNPAIVNDFPVGLKLVVSGNPEAKPVVESNKVKEEAPKSPAVSTKKYLEEYVVRPKETISSIASDYGMTEQELIALNPELKKGVKLGMILRVPKGQRKEPIKKEQGNLLKNMNTNARKQLALLLPFNISKIESDTVNSTQARLKKDKFLNMTLDFYSGALMAIDSARVLGMNVDIKILDSQETKNTSNVTTLATDHKLNAMDAVIGPFYQANVEKLAEILEPTKTPVISPLSKESGKKFSNLYQSMPSLDQMRASIFEFMRGKGGNVVAVVDPKKGSVKQYLQENQAGTRIIGLTAKNTFSADSLKVCLKKDKMNYVVLASESTGMILATTNAMLAFQKDYQVQLVIMEPNETLDFEEISLTRLTKLKLLYPSLTRPNESIEANQFDAKYKKLNKIIPNAYAIRGFDVTFDTLLRLSQEKTFEETIQNDDSEQIENKFNYNPNSTYGYSNNGIYILYYDIDLSIKEAS
ncbi:LysM peptidoglycan-binding domain-containing protein [Flavobacterium cheonhonense]|uniref:LysM peptidoglycan-binding domain-containing protein n=1 Tax=Flavobacterium cheonhonense TaxID=706185 RepID=A0ABP7UAT5_9FLAO|nr:LysM peptidoglycan-binding domain-containing protein [Flavobacterium cheonhonense]